MKYNYIVIEGNIGAGKTSLACRLAEDLNARLVLEQFSDNPFLPKFYENPERYSFPLELSFLAARYQQLKAELDKPDLFRPVILSDYYFMKSLIFAGVTLADEEYRLYRQLFHIIYPTLPRPDLFVYLHREPEGLLQNIKARGREYEKNITAGYLASIQKGYFDFFRQESKIPFLVLDVSCVDFVNKETDYLKMKSILFEKDYLSGINRVILQK